MVTLSFSQFLALFAWFPLAVLLSIVLLIARFYERFSKRRTYYRLYVIPIVLFGFAIVRYASIERISGDLAADAALTFAGVLLIGLMGNLYWCMILWRQTEEESGE